MENILKRINTLFIGVSILSGAYAVLFYLPPPWTQFNEMVYLFDQWHEKGPFALVMGLLPPTAYCFVSAIVSWVLGKGFKIHVRFK